MSVNASPLRALSIGSGGIMTAPGSIERLATEFRERYGVTPEVVIRAPGRVNLIGEHTDYALLPVMPFAIDREILIALGPGSEGLEIDSLESPAPMRLTSDAYRHTRRWHRYVEAAVLVSGRIPSARMIVGGNLPSTGGLSSSSALTLGVMKALAVADDEALSPLDLAARSVAAERSIGVEGGEMDQHVIALAEKGHALRIDFDPIIIKPIPIPEQVAIVVAYSGRPAPKAGSAQDLYNTRVVAARAAACLIGAETGVDPGSPPALGRVRSGGLDVALPENVTAEEAAAASGCDVRSIVGMAGADFPADVPLPIRRVARHILTEANRVDDTETAVAERRFDELGDLLDRSHRSLRRFGASSEALDQVTETLRTAGCHGARLTGAGFGGYALGVCDPDRVDRVLATLAETGIAPSFQVRAMSGVSVIDL